MMMMKPAIVTVLSSVLVNVNADKVDVKQFSSYNFDLPTS